MHPVILYCTMMNRLIQLLWRRYGLPALLYRWSANLPIHVIYLDDKAYMERYYIGSLFGWHFRLHRFVSADSERHLHNHPWEHGFSIILTGAYTEEVAVDICPWASDSGCVTKFIRRRFLNIVNGNTFHRIHDAKPGAWTLFCHGPRVVLPDGQMKGWGFLEQQQWFDPDWDLEGEDEGEMLCYTVYKPYQGSVGHWWETAPRGRDVVRMPL